MTGRARMMKLSSREENVIFETFAMRSMKRKILIRIVFLTFAFYL